MTDPLFDDVGNPDNPDPLWDRINKGLCTVLSCSGRLLISGCDVIQEPYPEWIVERAKQNGNPLTGSVTVTIYHYRCLECGKRLDSTEFIENALMN